MGSPNRMSLLRRKQTKPQQATDWLTTVLKLGAAGAAARGAGKATKKGAKKGAKKAAAQGGKGLGRRLAPIAAVAAVAVVAAKKLRSSDSGADSWQSSANGSPTPVAPPEPAAAPTPPSG
jgi:hypothetical protein